MKRTLIALATVATLGLSANTFAADAAAGKAKAASCAGCHGAAGISMVPIYPNLAGQKEGYMVKQLKAFKSGDRKDPTMNAMAKPLSDADMENIAAYYATLK
jgi:cytochrome c553